jgi:5-bromo-4-chloroindolyl phosphate hydrolysis protein
MKNKEIISGLIGGTFFALTYLTAGLPIVPALIAGAGAFVGGELILSKTNLVNFDKVDEKNIDEVLKDARNKNKFIASKIGKVDDKDLKIYLSEINITTSKIIETVSKNKKKIKSTEKFFTYYLPITVGIINKYDEIENQNLSSKEVKEFYTKANESLKEINNSFKKILNNLYSSDIENVETDMKVLNNILKSDGFNDIELIKEDKNE